jgi:hypothetical protein
MDEWITYLDAYERHLDDVSATIERGRITQDTFASQRPSRPIPRELAPRASTLLERGNELSAALQERMDAIKTVLRYSRMKDSSKVVLIDVLA